VLTLPGLDAQEDMLALKEDLAESSPAPPPDERKPVVLNLAGPHDTDAQRRKAAGENVTDPTQSFWADVADSFRLPLRARGLSIMAIVGIYLLIEMWVGKLGLLGAILNRGIVLLGWLLWAWVCGFYWNIVADTCRGEDDLPAPFADSSSPYDMLLAPVQYLATYLWAFLPMIVVGAWGYWKTGHVNVTAVLILWGLGVFLWPMTVLTICLHGASLSVLRYDLQFRTILSAFPTYLATCLVVLVVKWIEFAAVLNFLLPDFVQTYFWWIGLPSIVILLLSIVYFYLNMAAMRMVGLFYRHGKEHFPWAAE
jgi:hypothetical protein